MFSTAVTGFGPVASIALNRFETFLISSLAN
jgi:hypothetical protein